MAGPKTVLSAERSSVVALNFQADPSLIKTWIPPGFQPDLHNGDCYVSLIAVSLKNVRGRGLPFPLCLRLGSIYLRIYVCRESPRGVIRGFRQVRSIVTNERGRWLLFPLFGTDLKVARIRQTLSGFDGKATEENPPSAELQWKSGADRTLSRIKVTGRQRMTQNARDSKVGFILNHNWMFADHNGSTVAYQYRSERAAIWNAGHVTVQGETSDLVGDKLSRVMGRKPASVFLVEKSRILVTGPFPVEAAVEPKTPDRTPAPAPADPSSSTG